MVFDKKIFVRDVLVPLIIGIVIIVVVSVASSFLPSSMLDRGATVEQTVSSRHIEVYKVGRLVDFSTSGVRGAVTEIKQEDSEIEVSVTIINETSRDLVLDDVSLYVPSGFLVKDSSPSGSVTPKSVVSWTNVYRENGGTGVVSASLRVSSTDDFVKFEK